MTLRFYCPGRVIASIEYETDVYVVTPQIFLRYNVLQLGKEPKEIHFSFVDNFPLPKKLSSTKEKSIDNQFGLGNVTSAIFTVVDGVLHTYIGTSRGKLIDYVPDTHRITRIVDMSDHAITYLFYHQERCVCLTKTGINIVDDEEENRFQYIHLEHCTRFYPAAAYPAMIE